MLLNLVFVFCFFCFLLSVTHLTVSDGSETMLSTYSALIVQVARYSINNLLPHIGATYWCTYWVPHADAPN